MEALSLLQRPTFSTPKLVRTNVSESRGYGVYNNFHRFAVPVDNDLNRQWIKATLSIVRTVTDEAFQVESMAGLLLLSRIALTSSRGPIQTLDPVTLIARMGLIYGTPLYYKTLGGIEVDPDIGPDGFDVKTRTLYIPLFWFFSDKETDYLGKNRGPLWVDITTNETLESMGFAGCAITDIKYELFSNYAQTSNLIPAAPQKSITSYNSFIEDKVLVTTVSSESKVRMLLKCPYDVFYVHFYANAVGFTGSGTVSNVKIECPSSILFDRDIYTNSFDNGDSYDTSKDGTFTVKFGNRHQYPDRRNEYIKFSQTMTPTYATVTVQGVPSNTYEITAVCEYRNRISQDESGNLYEDVSGLFAITY